MKADLLKRLFRAIHDATPATLAGVARSIVEEERARGHAVLAGQLDRILGEPAPAAPPPPAPAAPMAMGSLPTSRRHDRPLSTLMPPELLRHQMVLPPKVERRFQRIEKEYAARDRLARHGLQYRKRILLYGPPGCGKSLGAERLAWTTGLPLMKVHFDAVMSSYFGESASNLRTVFDAVRATPTLLFLDECDFVGRSRSAGNDVGEAPRIVNTLLMLLEDYHAPGLLLAATNLDTSLDRALFRRFDEVLEIPPPGPEEVEKLLRLALSAIRCASDFDWSQVTEALRGGSAARVVKAAQDAAKQAVLGDDLPVRLGHLLSAIAELRQEE